MQANTPLIEPVEGDKESRWVTFVWRGSPDTKKVVLVGSPVRNDKFEEPLTQLGDTNLWYHTERVPKTARGTYAFVMDGDRAFPKAVHFTATMPDPLNLRAFSFGSAFELPDAPQRPYIKEHPGVPKGTLSHHTIKSAVLKEEREYGVYTPPGFDAKGKAYGLLVLFDGEVYGDGPARWVPAPTILDNLLARGKVPPMVLLLVDYISREKRNRDLPCYAPFLEFLATELVPAVRAEYNVSADPQHTVVGGSSFGGLAAACAGLLHSDVFGNILSQSGSFWYASDWRKHPFNNISPEPQFVMEQFARSPRLPLRFFIEVSLFEPGPQVYTNRHLRAVLELKGYPVTYSEFVGGHDYGCWRGSLADELIALVGNERQSVH